MMIVRLLMPSQEDLPTKRRNRASSEMMAVLLPHNLVDKQTKATTVVSSWTRGVEHVKTLTIWNLQGHTYRFRSLTNSSREATNWVILVEAEKHKLEDVEVNFDFLHLPDSPESTKRHIKVLQLRAFP
eukprot:604255-Hanusia_phi.AAC.1